MLLPILQQSYLIHKHSSTTNSVKNYPLIYFPRVYKFPARNLSTLLVPSNKFDSVPKAATVADFSQQEKLSKEKELLGFYVSDHPLKSVRSAAQVLAPINLSELEAQNKKALLCAVVMISSVKPITTKKAIAWQLSSLKI